MMTTRDEIMKMPAGREMDALIDAEVMSDAASNLSPVYPNYSTDISAAWKVVDEMKRRGWELRMEGVPAGQMVKFYNHKHDLMDGRRYTAGPAPLAICQAALLALESE